MTPEKTAGQGFGIAGSPDDNAGPRNQKADIFIKYDPRTRNGYSLRFWRTIQASDKCMFQLYQIVDGIGHPVSDQQQLTGVFKPNTIHGFFGRRRPIDRNRLEHRGRGKLVAEAEPSRRIITAVRAWRGRVRFPFGNSVVVSQFEISYPPPAR